MTFIDFLAAWPWWVWAAIFVYFYGIVLGT
jgi:hypothetical protein